MSREWFKIATNRARQRSQTVERVVVDQDPTGLGPILSLRASIQDVPLPKIPVITETPIQQRSNEQVAQTVPPAAFGSLDETLKRIS